MPDQIYIGNIAKGQITAREPFVIDNDAFPMLFNFYTWRGRVKRKRGTILLGQLQQQEQIASAPNKWQLASFNLAGGVANLITHYSLGTTATIVPGSISLTVAGDQVYTDPNMNGSLTGSISGANAGTINYATGAIVAGATNGAVTGFFSYFPGLPVMGLRDFVPNVETIYPLLLAFDTKRAYQVNQSSIPFFYDVTYYKATNTPFVWSGQDYQQFWTTNYSGALWATNDTPGFNFKSLVNVGGVSITQVSATQVTVTIVSPSGLIVGDLLWFNEVTGTIGTGSGSTANQNINGQTGVVANISTSGGNDVITVNFLGVTNRTSLANFQGGATGAGGIAQYLTATIAGQDGIKWYDGDPTGGTSLPTGTGLGWVNFAPPLTATSVSIDNFPSATYYLIGALAILPFKDRLLFFNAIIGTSNGTILYLQDTVVWSWNGTPYYTALTPVNQTYDIRAYYVDQSGLGGYLPAGISQPIMTVSANEDALLIGFAGPRGRKTRFVYTGDDFNPFLFFNINTEMTSDSTFSAITLDKGAIDIGIYGITMTDQQSSERIDLEIPDSVFTISNMNNGVQRVNAVRDFQKEWIYFTYPVNNSDFKYPTQTFLFNYRDNTWAVLYENYTAQGTFRKINSFTWATLPYNTWEEWTDPWNTGIGDAQFPNVVGGTPQGYVLIKGEGLAEAPSCTIQAIASANAGTATQITSINHCVTATNTNTEDGDFIYITGVLGLYTSTITNIASDISDTAQTIITTANTFVVGNYITISGVVGPTQLNGQTFKIFAATGTTVTIELDSTTHPAYVSGGTLTSSINEIIGKVIEVIDNNNFIIDFPFPTFVTGYLGLGVFAKLSQPLLQTKFFNPYWDQGRQVRLCAQKYLMDSTFDSQVTLDVYLSQDTSTFWNADPIYPNINALNNSLIYTQIMYTCFESQNLGLTAANTNLQMPTGATQKQIWHRYNTSLIGDSISIGITLSSEETTAGARDAQMYNLDYATSEITLHGINLVVEKGPHLA